VVEWDDGMGTGAGDGSEWQLGRGGIGGHMLCDQSPEGGLLGLRTRCMGTASAAQPRTASPSPLVTRGHLPPRVPAFAWSSHGVPVPTDPRRLPLGASPAGHLPPRGRVSPLLLGKPSGDGKYWLRPPPTH
jgi:hypothetical protein